MDDKGRVVVLGTGQMGSRIIRLLLQKQGCELVGVYGRRAHRAGTDPGTVLSNTTIVSVVPGGGKAGIIADPAGALAHKEALVRTFTRMIRTLTDYLPGPDMGTNEACMAWIKDEINWDSFWYYSERGRGPWYRLPRRHYPPRHRHGH
jgi:glutamate dehydrogenase/leucine dehydrogenase